MTKKLLMGNEAMAHAALEAGVGVVAGYPGTPSSEIVATIAHQHARGAAHGVHVEWSTNEKAALELLFGASLAGARGLFTCKQMGLNVASDALLSLNYVSVRGGLVLIVADDPGPISSQTEQDTRRFAMFAKVPVLDPSTPEQAYEMVKAAFELSERFHTPVIVRPTTRVDHASAFFDVQEETHALPVMGQGFQRDPDKYIIFPVRSYEAHGEINRRLDEIAEAFSVEQPFASFNPIMQTSGSAKAHPTRSNQPSYPAAPMPIQPEELAQPALGIMTSGITASYVREALRMITDRALKAGISIPAYRLMQVGTPYPFPERAVEVFAAGLSSILVLEELDDVLESELAQFAGRTHATLEIFGRSTGHASDRGENTVDDIMARIERYLGLTGRLSLSRFRGMTGQEAGIIHLSARGESELPSRPPVLCPGCPHRGSFYATTQALEVEGVEGVLCGDIGCYTLGNAQPLDALDTCLCMGAGITMAQGIAVANPDKKAIAYVGDSTLFASGETGLSNAAYNGHDITVMVLDNSTTAMTGFQPHPGTGITLMGDKNRALSIEEVLRANGFNYIERTNPFDRDQSVDKVRSALMFKGPSAVIFEGACAQLTKPKTPVVINREICTGCKRCITAIGCPAISFNSSLIGPRSRDRGQATIDEALCNGCGLCTQVCPFHAIHIDSPVYRASASNLAAEAGGWPAVNPEQQARINEFKEHRAKHALSAEDAIAAAVEVAAAVEAAAGDEPVIDQAEAERIEAAVAEIISEDREAAAAEQGASQGATGVAETAGVAGVAGVTGSAEAAEAAASAESTSYENNPYANPPVPALADEDERIGADEVVREEVAEIAQEEAVGQTYQGIAADAYHYVPAESEAAAEVAAVTVEDTDEAATEMVVEAAPEMVAGSVAGSTVKSATEAPKPDLEYVPTKTMVKPAGERPVHMEGEDANSAYETQAGEGIENYHGGVARKKTPSSKPARGKHAAPDTIAIAFDFGSDDDEDDIITNVSAAEVVVAESVDVDVEVEYEASYEVEYEAEYEVDYETDDIEDVEDAEEYVTGPVDTGEYVDIDYSGAAEAKAAAETAEAAEAVQAAAEAAEASATNADAPVPNYTPLDNQGQTPWRQSAGYDAWGSYNIDSDIQEDDPRA